MTKILRLLSFLLIFPFSQLFAQVPDGTICPDYIITDLNGNSHDIQAYLGEGKMVFIEVFATWASPCWLYHSSGALQTMYAEHGPDGLDDVVVLMIEGDPFTTVDDISNINSNQNNQGDYTLDTPYPICEGPEDFMEIFSINYFPTIYAICTNGIMFEIDQLEADLLVPVAEQFCSSFAQNNLSVEGNIEGISTCNPGAAKVINRGLSSSSSFQVEVSVNGELVSTQAVPGPLAYLEFYTVDLSMIDYSSEAEIGISIDYPDENELDNLLIGSVVLEGEMSSHIRIEVLTDDYMEETSWYILDSEGNVIIESEEYTLPQHLYSQDYYLPALGCYTIRFVDTYGDGFNASQWGGPDGSAQVSSIDEFGLVNGIIASIDGNLDFSELAFSFGVGEIIEPVYSACVFHDVNDNGYFDEDETTVSGVEIFYGNTIVYTGENGCVELDYDEEFGFVSIHQDVDAFPLNTIPVQMTINSLNPNAIFGISSNDPNYNMGISYTQMTEYFCNFSTSVYAQVCNEGNQAANGEFEIVIAPLLTVTGFYPYTATQDGNTISWHISDLPIGQCSYYQVFVEAPSFEAMGEIATNSAILSVLDPEGNEIEFIQEDYEHEILCSYDPNDKQVWPAGETEAGYILNGTELEYLVRFQNTGNAPAFNVRVDDDLDTDLNWQTFELISTSHYCEPSINTENGHVEFYFPDIMLPDSTANEPESHGFIRYKISLQPDREEGTPVENTAYIYFDFNPAVVTNTTLNTVSDLYFGIESAARKQLVMYPNPTSNSLLIELGEIKGAFTLNLYSAMGRLVKSEKMNAVNQMLFSVNDYPAGMYTLEIIPDSDSQDVYMGRFVKQ